MYSDASSKHSIGAYTSNVYVKRIKGGHEISILFSAPAKHGF